MAVNMRLAGMGEAEPNDRLFAALSYVFSPLVPAFILLSESNKARQYQRYHAVNSLLVALVWIVLIVVLCILSSILGFIPVIGWIAGCVLWLLPLAMLGLVIWYAVLAYQGKYFDLPVLTDFGRQQGWI